MIRGALYDAVSPHTVLACRIRGLIQGTAFNRGAYLMLKVTLNVGYEKSRQSFKAGEVAYDPADEWLIIFLRDTQQARNCNPIGILEDLSSIELKYSNKMVLQII